jgi:two-component system NtrC family sensor kinase
MDPQDIERLAKELAIRKRLQEALLVFSRGVSARLALAAALETLSEDVTNLFGARRTSVWMHDRRRRILTLTGSSDPRESALRSSVSTDDDSIVARGLRLDAPELSGRDTAQCLVVPLRGWRRALGTIVIEGAPREVDAQLFVELSADFGRQLSIAVERILVLDEFIGDMTRQAQLRGRLAQTEKLAALGQFVAGIAHEINNPLQGVLGYAELLIETTPADSPQQPDLRRIYREAERAAEIVRNLLVFTGANQSPREAVDLAQVVARTVAMREPALQKEGIDIVQHGVGVPAGVMGDAGRLQQALLNVLINAEQAIASSRDAGRIVVTIETAGPGVTIHVDDTGPGVAADALPRIFDPFFTTKDVGQGTGLGLAISYGIIQDHGGMISAGASPLGGARFTIHLPRNGKVGSSGATE